MPSPSDAPALQKFPRTPHLEGSSLQAGDEALRVTAGVLSGQGELVYAEKVDGANAAFRFDGAGELLVQSRGHYLAAADRNAPRERDWTLLKDWLAQHRDAFLDRFEDRYVVYGEWAAVTHSVFYDRLPGYFLEFDILDLAEGCFLDTPARRALCRGLPIASVPVLARTAHPLPYKEMLALVRPSVFRSGGPSAPQPEQDGLRRACALVGDDYARRLPKMDQSGLSEGLYVKVERDGAVVRRCKWVRPGFTQAVLAADEHWQSRFPVPNLLGHLHPDFPAHLAGCRQPPPAPYDADAPWDWAAHASGPLG